MKLPTKARIVTRMTFHDEMAYCRARAVRLGSIMNRRFSRQTSKAWKQAERQSMISPVVFDCCFWIVLLSSFSSSWEKLRRKMIITVVIMANNANVCFKLNVLRMRRRLHLQKKAEMGRARALVAMDIDGSIMLRPKINRMF